MPRWAGLLFVSFFTALFLAAAALAVMAFFTVKLRAMLVLGAVAVLFGGLAYQSARVVAGEAKEPRILHNPAKNRRASARSSAAVALEGQLDSSGPPSSPGGEAGAGLAGGATEGQGARLRIVRCPHCGTRVVPTADNTCPACRKSTS